MLLLNVTRCWHSSIGIPYHTFLPQMPLLWLFPLFSVKKKEIDMHSGVISTTRMVKQQVIGKPVNRMHNEFV